ncbi:aspartic proteinase precursor [Fomes fomentarius]|nr:aspartic proteinase precursor [Fomes fomentarius]
MLARVSALLAFTAAAVVVGANPVVIRDSPVTLPIARRFNSTGVLNILAADKARAKVLKSRSQAQRFKQSAVVPVPVTNQAVIYTVSLGVGTPPTQYDLIVDTGSSNTWIGAGKDYVKTESSVDTGEEVVVFYGSGFFFGEEYTETVTLGDLVIENQGVGVADFAIGFDGYDGILGGAIDAALVGISFEPTTEEIVTNGALTFGGIDETKFDGELAYVPITSTSPASSYVGIDQSITYGSAGTEVLAATAGITDTGTTLILIASDAFAVYQNLTGGVADDQNTGLLKLTQEQFDNLESLFFHIGDNTYELTPNAQIWPRALNTAIGGEEDAVYSIVADLGSNSGEGLDFIDGFAFLERFYQVYDVTNSQVGFATTQFTNATIN